MGLTCTLTGTIYRDDGAVATGAVVSFTLCAPRNTHWTSNNRVVLRAVLSATTDGSGNFSQVVARNDELTPAGTYWKVECADAALLKHIAANADTLNVIDAPDLDASAQVFSGLDDPDADWVAHGHAQTLTAAKKLQAATNLGLNLSASQLLGQASSGGTGLPVAVTLGTGLAMSGTTLNATSSVSDGDKGDITVSNTGATWTIDNDTITLAKLAHMSTARVVGRTTAGTGTPELLTISGTGSVAMTTSPSFTTPALGTPSAIVLTNATGTASININGTVGATTPDTVAGTTITGTSSLTLGTNGGTGGSIVLNGATSGSSTLSVSATGVLALPSFTAGSITVGSGIVSAAILTAQNPSVATLGIDINPYNSATQVTAGHPWMRLGGGSSERLMINAGLTGGYVDICTDLGSGLIVHDGTGGHETFLTTPATGTLRVTTDGSTLGTVEAATGTFTTLTASATTSILLGTAGSAVGNIGFRNATSGTTTLAPATGALGTGTVTLPLTGTLATLEGANAFTAENINSKSGAASVTAMKFTGVPFAGTGTTSFPLVYINDANATASTTLNTAGTYFGVNGDGTQDLMNLLVDGVSKCRVKSTGETLLGGTTVVIGGGLNVSGGGMWANGPVYAEGFIGSRHNGGIQIAAEGIVTMRNLAYTDVASQLNFGNLSSASYPAWRREASSTTLKARLSDNSADCPITASNMTASGTLAVTGATTLTGNLTSNGAYISTPQALSGNGAVAAVSLTTEVTTIANTGTANTTTTLAAGTNGQRKVISFITDGGFDAVITVTNPAWGGAGTITMNDALDNIEMRYLNSVWQVFINNGCTLA